MKVRIISLALICIASASTNALAVTAESKEHTKKGIAFFQAGKANDAIKEFQKAIELDPTNADYHRNLSMVYMACHRSQESIKEAQLSLKYNPQDTKTINHLVGLLMSEKRFSEAEKYIQQTIKSQASNTIPLRSKLLICLDAQDKKAPLETECNRLLKIKPNNSGALMFLSKCMSEQKKTAEAERLAYQAVKYDSNNSATHLLLANILKSRGKDKEAIKEYQSVLQLNPKCESAKEIKEMIHYLSSKVDTRIP